MAIPTSPPAFDTIRVMIVDDSAVIRGAIARSLDGDPSFSVFSSVANGEQAVRALERTPVDVIVLDIEMPIMDGLTALPKLKAIDPAVQIIMASTLTLKNADVSIKALELGASDYIPKPTSNSAVLGSADFKRELVEKVKVFGDVARRRGVRPPEGGFAPKQKTVAAPRTQPMAASPSTARPLTPSRALPDLPVKKDVVLRRELVTRPDVIAIGSSTGGPKALFRVIKDMGADLPQPIVITQHMPPAFTAILADHITRQCQVTCAEAKDGERLEASRYYVAPGDFHMLIDNRGGAPTVKLVKDPPENFCRPSVDPMLRSLVNVYGKRILTVILTGMGQDGLKGGEMVVNAGGSIIAQDEATSVVWGMPGSVAMAGLCSSVLGINEIGAFVRQTALRARA